MKSKLNIVTTRKVTKSTTMTLMYVKTIDVAVSAMLFDSIISYLY